jgi:hypothetical protein
MTSSDQDVDRAAFQHVVDKLSARDGFMAKLLHVAFGGDVSAARIAKELHCSEDAALRLAMMRSPGTERDKFRSDIARIAEDVGIDIPLLSATIRQARALSAFATPAAGNLLMAARDQFGDDEDH